MLKGKTILLGVTGGIAAYKAAALASALVKQHAAVEVVMTKNATQFITPLTFEELTGRRVMVDTFDRNFSHQVEHISLAQRVDLLIIAPATANVCAKLAHGLADDMLTTTALACRCPKLIAPAMNTNMFENPVTQDNLALLRRYGWEVIEPASGRLACRTDPGSFRSGAVSNQSLQRKNGLCYCKKRYAPRCGCHPCARAGIYYAPTFCESNQRGFRGRYVPGGGRGSTQC